MIWRNIWYIFVLSVDAWGHKQTFLNNQFVFWYSQILLFVAWLLLAIRKQSFVLSAKWIDSAKGMLSFAGWTNFWLKKLFNLQLNSIESISPSAHFLLKIPPVQPSETVPSYLHPHQKESLRVFTPDSRCSGGELCCVVLCCVVLCCVVLCCVVLCCVVCVLPRLHTHSHIQSRCADAKEARPAVSAFPWAKLLCRCTPKPGDENRKLLWSKHLLFFSVLLSLSEPIWSPCQLSIISPIQMNTFPISSRIRAAACISTTCPWNN